MVVPFVEENLQGGSLDLTLAPDIKVWEPKEWIGDPLSSRELDVAIYPELDPSLPLPPMNDYTIKDYWYLMPGDFIIASTVERVSITTNMVAKVEGKSSRGRLGLSPIVGAGWIDPGFSGQITLEIVNQNPNCRIVLRPGMKICQIVFAMLDRHARNPYQGRYQNQVGATAAREEKKV
jgi:deoxycytidine triphosphate deaminase